MNCPKCGRELIIGSDLCPVCDVANEPAPEKNKQGKKLTKVGKIVFGFLSLLLLFLIVLFVCLSIKGNTVNGPGNGNYLNGGLAVEKGNRIYYSTVNELYVSNKKLSDKQLLDTGGEIKNLVYAGRCLYYTKDKKIYEYNTKTGRLNSLSDLEGDTTTVAGFSNKCIYYNDGSYVKKLSLDTKEFDNRAKGTGVFDKGKLYFIYNSELFCLNPKTNAKDKIATVDPYITPAFVKSGRVFCYEQKDQNLISISIKDGNTIEELSTAELEDISDIEHINYYKDYFLLRGESGIYRVDPNSKEVKKLFDIDYVESPIIVLNDRIFLCTPDGSAFIGDTNGKIKYKSLADKKE